MAVAGREPSDLMTVRDHAAADGAIVGHSSRTVRLSYTGNGSKVKTEATEPGGGLEFKETK